MADLKQTPLFALHGELGARMTPFAGYDMPVQYPMGVMKEHLHCRAAAGLFDVSHMGQVLVTPLSGNLADAALALETLVPADVAGLAEGRQRYGLFTNTTGGIHDDLMFANRGDHLFLVVNAACKDQDIALLTDGKRTLFAPALQVTAQSTVGAGDAMIGGVMMGLSRGEDMEACFRYGMAAGAASVMTSGTQSIRVDDFASLLPKVTLQTI